jgi:hypothetical protein
MRRSTQEPHTQWPPERRRRRVRIGGVLIIQGTQNSVTSIEIICQSNPLYGGSRPGYHQDPSVKDLLSFGCHEMPDAETSDQREHTESWSRRLTGVPITSLRGSLDPRASSRATHGSALLGCGSQVMRQSNHMLDSCSLAPTVSHPPVPLFFSSW